MNKALTAKQVQGMFDAVDRVKEERRIRIERKKQDKQNYHEEGGTR